MTRWSTTKTGRSYTSYGQWLRSRAMFLATFHFFEVLVLIWVSRVLSKTSKWQPSHKSIFGLTKQGRQSQLDNCHIFIPFVSLSLLSLCLKKRANFGKLCFGKQGLFLIIFTKQHQYTFKMMWLFIFPCSFTFVHFICF